MHHAFVRTIGSYLKKWSIQLGLKGQTVWSCLVYRMLENSNILTINYGVKQSQFIKPISEPHARNPEDSNETFERVIRWWLL